MVWVDEERNSMAILSGVEIQKQIEAGRIVANPYDPQLVNVDGNSYDVRLGDKLRVLASYSTLKTLLMMRIGRKPSEIKSSLLKMVTKLSNFLDENKGEHYVDPRNPPLTLEYDLEECPYLMPGVLYLGSTAEAIGSDHYVPILHGKSSLARLGLSIHITAGFGEAGFKSQWTLEMTTVHPFKLYAGMRIGQVEFETIEGEIRPYKGSYMDQAGPTPSRMNKYFDENGQPR